MHMHVPCQSKKKHESGMARTNREEPARGGAIWLTRLGPHPSPPSGQPSATRLAGIGGDNPAVRIRPWSQSTGETGRRIAPSRVACPPPRPARTE